MGAAGRPSALEHAEEFLERLDFAKKGTHHARAFGAVLAAFREHLKRRADDAARTNRTDLLADIPATGSFLETQIAAIRQEALRLAAAEVSGFLKAADPKLERWAPYRQWVKTLAKNDTVITYNYDRVPDLLNDESSEKLWIPTFVAADELQTKPTILKVH
jgi:hypothetical protein